MYHRMPQPGSVDFSALAHCDGLHLSEAADVAASAAVAGPVCPPS